MIASAIPEIWDSLSLRLQRSLVLHVKYAEAGTRGYQGGRWRAAELGTEALSRKVIEPREHPRHYLAPLGWELGRHGLKLEKEADGKKA